MITKPSFTKSSFTKTKFLICALLCVLAVFVSVVTAQGIDGGGLPSSPDQLTPEQRSQIRNMSPDQQAELRRAYESGSKPSASSSASATPAASDMTPELSSAEADAEVSDTETDIDNDEMDVDRTINVRDGGLRHFGYDVFASIPDAFKPAAIGPIDPGYMVGPGDVLRLAVWGQSEFTHELTVNNDGKILIPVTGQVHVSGIPFSELQTKLQNLLSRHYSGLSAKPQRTFMDLSVAQLRPVRIYIMGEVRNPGGYTVSSFANAFSALYSVGGPLERGSLREIRVIRNGKTVATVDIYDYLLTGGSNTDVRLQSNDVVFVPPRGKTVHVTGSVVRPAIYELKADEHFQRLLAFSGGVRTSSNADKAHLLRVLPFGQRSESQPITQKIDFELKRYLDGKEDFDLHDQDRIGIVSLFDDLSNIVTITGAVQYPGVYQSDNLTLRELVFTHARVVSRSLADRADLIRLNEDKVTTRVIPINLSDLQKGIGDQKLEPFDEVVVYDIEVARPLDLQVIVEGEVRNPGTYRLHTNMTLTDAIIAAGGFTRMALKTKFDVYRRDTVDSEKLIIIERTTLPGGGVSYIDEEQRLFSLSDRDRIIVRPDPNISVGRFVTVTGAVTYTGTYALEHKNERFTSVIKRAGGFQTDAYHNGIVITRGGRRLMINSDALYNDNSKKDRKRMEDVILHDNDVIHVPRRPNNVLVQGEVNAPGLYGFIPGARMRDYIERAGGYTDSVNFVLVSDPSGETRKIKKRSNIDINDGTEIRVTKKPAKPEREKSGPSAFDVIRDTLAIVVTALTVVVLVTQINKD